MRLIKTLSLTLILIQGMKIYASDIDQHIFNQNYQLAINAGCKNIIKKRPQNAFKLGLLPGGGSFYTNQIGLGVIDALSWPISIIWDSQLAIKKAEEINMLETVYQCIGSGKLKVKPVTINQIKTVNIFL
jgi:hypothetical protein